MSIEICVERLALLELHYAALSAWVKTGVGLVAVAIALLVILLVKLR